MLRLITLGECALRDGSRRLRLRGGRDYALLAYLASHPGARVTRQALAELFWDSGSSASRLHSLSQLIYSLRSRALGDVLRADARAIGLVEEGLAYDVRDFHAALQAKDYAHAYELARGPFMEGVEFAGASEFFEWRDRMRHELSALAAANTRHLLQAAEDRGDLLGAERYLRELLRNAVHEDLHERLLRLLIARGDAAGARDEHARHLIRLEAETGEPPSLEARGLVERIAKESVEVILEEKRRIRLVGREAELGFLREQLRATGANSPRIAVVRGRAGVGKTHLCAYFVRSSILRGARVLIGHCAPETSRFPYAAINDSLGSVVGGGTDDLPADARLALSLLNPAEWRSGSGRDLGALEREEAKDQIRRGLWSLVSVLASESPLIWFVDDFQWADESSRELIGYLGRREGAPVLFVLSARTEDVPDPAEALRWHRLGGGPAVLDITELPRSDSIELIREFERTRGARLNHAVHDAIATKAGGHPFLLLELLRCAAESPVGADSPHFLGYDGLPETVRSFLRSRLSALPPSATAVAAALAALGQAAAATDVEAVSGLEPLAFVEAVDALIGSGLVEDVDGELRFRHDLAREAAYSSMSGPRRRLVHGRVAKTLERRGTGSEPGLLAFHFDLAGNSEKAFGYARAAANANLRVHALNEAEYFLRLALRNASGKTRLSLTREQLADCLYLLRREVEADGEYALVEEDLTGKRESIRLQRIRARRITMAYNRRGLNPDEQREAASLLERALEMPPLMGASIIGYVLGPLFTCGMATNELLESLGRFVHRLEEAPPHAEIVIGLCRVAELTTICHSGYIGLEFANKAQSMASHLSTPLGLVSALSARGVAQLIIGRTADAEATFSAAYAEAQRTSLRRVVCVMCVNWAVLRMEIGDYAGSESLLGIAERIATEDGTQREPQLISANRVYSLFERGAIPGAVEMARGMAARYDVLEFAISAQIPGIIGLGTLTAAPLSELGVLRDRILEAYGRPDPWGPDFSYAEMFLARLSVLEGETDAALERLTRVIEAYKERDVFCRSRLQLEKARILAPTRPDEAVALAREVRARGSEMGAKPLMDRAEAILREIRRSAAKRSAVARRT